MVHPHRQRGEEGATVPLQPEEAEEMWPVTKNTHKLLQMHNREHPVGCITAWYGNFSAHNCKALQMVVRSVQRITRGKLPAFQDTYTTRYHRKAKKIIKDNNSFYLKAIRLLNSHH